MSIPRWPLAVAAAIVLSAVAAPPVAHAGGQCTDLYEKNQLAWQQCAQDHSVECEKTGQGTLGSGWDCHYPDGSHDECIKFDETMGKVVGSCEYYPPGVRDPDGYDR